MGDLVGDEVDKIWQQLVQSWVRTDRFQRSSAESHLLLVRIVIQNGRLDLVEVEDQLLGDDVLN
jgi:hypothetical protein